MCRIDGSEAKERQGHRRLDARIADLIESRDDRQEGDGRRVRAVTQTPPNWHWTRALASRPRLVRGRARHPTAPVPGACLAAEVAVRCSIVE